MINTIEIKFSKLLSDITDDFNGSNDMLIKNYSVKELNETGFIRSNVSKIVESVPKNTLSEYFEEHISKEDIHTIGEIEQKISPATVGEFIEELKKEITINYLSISLSNYIFILKGEKNAN